MVAKVKSFDPMIWVLNYGIEDTLLQRFLLSNLYSFDSIFSNIV